MHCNSVAGSVMASPDLVAGSTAAALGFVPPKRNVRHARACRGHPRLGSKVRRGWPGRRRAIGEQSDAVLWTAMATPSFGRLCPAMTVESWARNFGIVIFSMYFAEPCGSVAARRIPAGWRAKFSIRTLRNPEKREAERRNSRARNAAPVGPPYGRAGPSSGRDADP